MRTWIRLPNATLCGECGTYLADNSPALAIQLPNLKRKLIRGPCCAGEAPPDLPEHIERSQFTTPMQPLKKSKPEWLPYREES